jgi:hypothetical protein
VGDPAGSPTSPWILATHATQAQAAATLFVFTAAPATRPGARPPS